MYPPGIGKIPVLEAIWGFSPGTPRLLPVAPPGEWVPGRGGGRPGLASGRRSEAGLLVPTPTPSTLIDDAFAQVNDRRKPDLDDWTVRGKVSLSQSEADQVVHDGLRGGVTVRIHQAAGGTPSLLDTGGFSPFRCESVASGRSLLCKSGRSFVRLRRTRSSRDPNGFRISASVRQRDLASPPYALPLWFEVEVGGQSWVGYTSFSYCRVSYDGARTTCRLPRAG